MTTTTPKPTDLTPTAIALLRALNKASTTGIPAISLVPDVMSTDYEALIAADLIEVRSVSINGRRVRDQSLPHVFIRPAGVRLLDTLQN